MDKGFGTLDLFFDQWKINFHSLGSGVFRLGGLIPRNHFLTKREKYRRKNKGLWDGSEDVKVFFRLF
jgi:hypothetical protein